MTFLGKPKAGFYAILDSAYVDDAEWEYKAESLLAGGACLLQVRAKGHPVERVAELVERALPAARKFDVPLIVNDHLEVALEIPGTGLHLGQDDGDIRKARKLLGPDRILGLSTHSIDQARLAISAADILSYFAVGPVFATGTKPDYTPVGLELVRKVAREQPPLPFFCIGGINRSNLEQVLEAGAKGVVAVSDPLLDENTEAATRVYADRLA
jgi:thiamine-phosphate pyrophosphorylase